MDNVFDSINVGRQLVQESFLGKDRGRLLSRREEDIVFRSVGAMYSFWKKVDGGNGKGK